jgi:cyclopropane fatty-acyl-phospholipid synthase-like methyltransferase
MKMSESKPRIDPYPLSTYNTWAWERNRDPILQVFKTFFPEAGDVLELASGSGSHINYFARHFSDITFQPSDCDVNVFETIRSNRARAGNTNVADPLRIDLTEPDNWPKEERLYDVIFAINVFHLAPISAADGFAEIAARVLKPEGIAAIYGPFKVDGSFTTASNHAFDRSLRAASVPGWGLKDVRDVEKAMHNRGIALKQQLDLPANNFMLVFQKENRPQT